MWTFSAGTLRASLRGRLFVLLIAPLILVAGLAASGRFMLAERLSERLYDNTLLAVALTISRDVVLSEGDLLTEELLEALTQSLGDPLYYRVTGPEGSFVTGYSDLPSPPPGLKIRSGAPVFYDSVSFGKPVRVVVLREFISEPQFGGWVTVEVWQNVTQRAALSFELLLQSASLLTVLVGTAALILWFGIKRGLQPLQDLRAAIGTRSADDLRPIRRWVPPELRPVVDTTNSLFARLSQAIAQRDAFISDAAHQVRNPIAAIQAQAEAALSAPDERTLRNRVTTLAQAARHAGRLTNQLLSLERMRGRTLRNLAVETDLSQIVESRTRQFAERQLPRGIEVSFHQTGTPRRVIADGVMIEEALENLLTNAAHYGCERSGEIAVSLNYLSHAITLSVSDSGPGIPLDMQHRVFDRFFRLRDDGRDGCGLGLAIVMDVAQAHGGHARITNKGILRGTTVEMVLMR